MKTTLGLRLQKVTINTHDNKVLRKVFERMGASSETFGSDGTADRNSSVNGTEIQRFLRAEIRQY